MEVVVEDPTAENGVRTYRPGHYRYDEATRTWALVLEVDGERIERLIPNERIVYIEEDDPTRGPPGGLR